MRDLRWTVLCVPALLVGCFEDRAPVDAATDAERVDAAIADTSDALDVAPPDARDAVSVDVSDVIDAPAIEGGVSCGGAASVVEPTSCAPDTSLTLDPAICRCILGWIWDGSACVSLSNCHCYGACASLYASREACLSAYARCRDGG